MGQNVHNNYLMGLIFWKCWRVALKKFKFLFFLKLIYIVDHVYTFIAIWDKMCTTTILWV